jgi:hypothetical protein
MGKEKSAPSTPPHATLGQAAELFTGQVYLDIIAHTDDGSRLLVNAVRFHRPPRTRR